MLITTAMEKMIDFYKGNTHDINHFLKVWAFAKTIGEAEGLDKETQEILELAAVVHDISCPLCREKYGNADGRHQILLEADFLVNADEGGYSKEAIENACRNIFRTDTGIRLLKSIYLEEK